MGLIEMIDTNAINHLSELSDKSFKTAMTMIEKNRKEREEAQNSECARRLEELFRELQMNHWALQCYNDYTEEWYDIDFDDIRIRKRK